ncbi:MAG TPA: hypothetical protein VJV05_04765 [Pyrinomonadaceae bacterium]|nr:hypothetical protein [Pyrinomonadaceae bacterium]
MRVFYSPTLLAAILLVFTCGGTTLFAQSQEISEVDGQPVLLQHLPDYESVRSVAQFTTDRNKLKTTVGDPIIDQLEFWPGTEAVTAVYPEGRLVIVEYTNPQSSIEIDTRIQQQLAATQSQAVYRRIGNYNAFVFGGTNPEAANALLDKVKYQKTVQWLGEDPYILKKLERYMVSTSRDIMISTVLVIVFGLGGSVLAGIAAGFIFFRMRDQKRSQRAAFSDSGGLTRLNLDGLSE